MSSDESFDELTDAVSGLLRTAVQGKETVFDITEKDGIRRVEIVRRDALPETRKEPPSLDRGQKRAHVFHDHMAFARYVAREGVIGETLVLADANAAEITAILQDFAELQAEKIRMRATHHPLCKPWLEILDKPIAVLDFGLFCSRNRRAIAKPDGREVALIFQQIKIAKVVEINRGVGAKALNGVMIQTEISGQTSSSLVEIPETIEIECPIYIGGKPIRVPLDILITDRNDDVVVYVTCPMLAQVKCDAFQLFVEEIQKFLGDEHLVGLGTVILRRWRAGGSYHLRP